MTTQQHEHVTAGTSIGDLHYPAIPYKREAILIPVRIDELLKKIEEVLENLIVLEKQLSPILVSDPNAGEAKIDAVDPPVISTIQRSLISAQNRLDDINYKIEHIRYNLDL